MALYTLTAGLALLYVGYGVISALLLISTLGLGMFSHQDLGWLLGRNRFLIGSALLVIPGMAFFRFCRRSWSR